MKKFTPLLILLALALIASPVYAAVFPTVAIKHAEIDNTTATLWGNITATGGGNCTQRGFVWDTATHADPGDVAPGDSAYASSWTETGVYGTGTFDYDATGLTEKSTYYFRAGALSSTANWSYSTEYSFFITEADETYLEFRPDLDETKIRGQLGIPSDVNVGCFNGYSLPITDGSDNETLNYLICVPDRWDEETDILLHIDAALSMGNQADRSYKWKLNWEHYTPIDDVVPATCNIIYFERYIYSDTQYQSYQDWMVIDYDIDAGDAIHPDDLIALSLSRVTVEPKQTDSDEIYVFAVDILFAEDVTENITLSFDESLTIEIENITTIISEATDILVDNQTSLFAEFLTLLIASIITILAFWKRNIILYCLAVPIDLVLGLSLATSATVASARWIEGLAITVIGLFFLFRVAIDAFVKSRKEKNTPKEVTGA